MKALVAGLLCIAAAPATASPLDLFGFGARSPALAATGVATADDFECLYLNPAGLGEVKMRRVSAGTLLGTFDLSGVSGEARKIDTAFGIEVGAAFPLPLGGFLKDRVGLGFGIYVPTTMLNRARAPRTGVPFFALLENRSQVVGVQLGVGVKISRQWSAGAGVLVLGGIAGGIDVTPDAAGRFATVSEQQLIAAYSPIFGVRFHASDRLTLGSTLHTVSKSTYDIAITSNLGDALPITLPEIHVRGVAQYDPLSVATEAAWRPSPRLLLTGNLTWQHWSAFPLPTENPVADMPPQAPADFHDTVIPRVSAEVTVGSTRLRAGSAFILSPAPEMKGQQALLDNHRVLLSAGAGFVAGPFRIDAWLQTHFLLPRHHDRPEGQDDVDTSGTIVVGGFMMGVDL